MVVKTFLNCYWGGKGGDKSSPPAWGHACRSPARHPKNTGHPLERGELNAWSLYS